MRKNTHQKPWNAAVKTQFWLENATIPISAVSAYHKEPLQNPSPQSKRKEDAATTISGTYKDDDSKYSLRNLLKRQETEAGNED